MKRKLLCMVARFFEKSAYLYANATCTGRFYKTEIPEKLKKESKYYEIEKN